MKRCLAATTIGGAKIRCKLPLNHNTESLGLMSGPLTKHEYWETRKVKGGYRNIVVEWYPDKDYKYGELQGDARGGPYKGIK